MPVRVLGARDDGFQPLVSKRFDTSLACQEKLIWRCSSKEERWPVEPGVAMSGFVISANLIEELEPILLNYVSRKGLTYVNL